MKILTFSIGTHYFCFAAETHYFIQTSFSGFLLEGKPHFFRINACCCFCLFSTENDANSRKGQARHGHSHSQPDTQRGESHRDCYSRKNEVADAGKTEAGEQIDAHRTGQNVAQRNVEHRARSLCTLNANRTQLKEERNINRQRSIHEGNTTHVKIKWIHKGGLSAQGKHWPLSSLEIFYKILRKKINYTSVLPGSSLRRRDSMPSSGACILAAALKLRWT